MSAAVGANKKKNDSLSTDCENDVAMKDTATSKSEDDIKKNNADDKLCPLFMDGLPTDFSSNPSLAAIASLLEDEDSDDVTPKTKEYKALPTREGGGKVRQTPVRSKRRNEGRPYSSSEHRKRRANDNKATVGEANLFLKMWKL